MGTLQSSGPIIAEDAAMGVVVVEFGACCRAAQAGVERCRQKHSERGSYKVDPERAPELREHGAAKRPRRIHAHA